MPNASLEHPESVNVNDMVQNFYEKITEIVNETIPSSVVKSKQHGKQPWINKSALRSIKKKYHSWKRFCESKKHHHYQEYIKQRDKATKTIREQKYSYEKKLAKECKQNPKAFFRYCNTKSKTNSQVIRLKGNDNEIILGDKQNAEHLNNYFSSVFTRENDKVELIQNEAHELIFGEKVEDPFDLEGPTLQNNLPSVDITINKVYNILTELDPFKSSSETCIHPRILKEAASELAEPISNIFKCSLYQGHVPEIWKIATVTPIHKGNDRHEAKNYRPISITSTLCRCLEKIIKKDMMDHLVTNSALSNHQHGFRSGKSCMSNLLETLEDITKMYDEGLPVDEIFLDFAKAFDKVPHQRLVYKLKKYGIHGDLLCWIESFLSDRYQRTRVKDSLSTKGRVYSGVPQGSVLGPILFLIYINDLPSHINSLVKIFADDSKLYNGISNDDDVENLQADLNALIEWTKTWQMEFNKDKCHVMHYHKKNPLSIYHLNGHIIESCDTEKDLGVLLSKDLKPSPHIANITLKAYQKLAMINRTFTYKDEETVIPAYKALVRPLLEYCQEVWSPHLIKDIESIEAVQRRATKMIPKIRHLSYEERLSHLNLFKLSARRHRGDMITMFKILNGIIEIKENLFTRRHTLYESRTHDKKLMLQKKANSDMRINTFTHRVVIPWNNLPSSVVNSKNVDSFKKEYDKYVKLK